MNALEAFFEFVYAHRHGRPADPGAVGFIASRLKDYLDGQGSKSLDEVFEVRPSGRGKRDPWLVYLKECRAWLCSERMAQLTNIGFSVDEAAAAIAALYASLDDNDDWFGGKLDSLSAESVRREFFHMGGLEWAKQQILPGHEAGAYLLSIIPKDALPLRFQSGGK